MYQKYADALGWKVALVSESLAESGGYKECILQITGDRCVQTILCTPSRVRIGSSIGVERSLAATRRASYKSWATGVCRPYIVHLAG